MPLNMNTVGSGISGGSGCNIEVNTELTDILSGSAALSNASGIVYGSTSLYRNSIYNPSTNDSSFLATLPSVKYKGNLYGFKNEYFWKYDITIMSTSAIPTATQIETPFANIWEMFVHGDLLYIHASMNTYSYESNDTAHALYTFDGTTFTNVSGSFCDVAGFSCTSSLDVHSCTVKPFPFQETDELHFIIGIHNGNGGSGSSHYEYPRINICKLGSTGMEVLVAYGGTERISWSYNTGSSYSGSQMNNLDPSLMIMYVLTNVTQYYPVFLGKFTKVSDDEYSFNVSIVYTENTEWYTAGTCKSVIKDYTFNFKRIGSAIDRIITLRNTGAEFAESAKINTNRSQPIGNCYYHIYNSMHNKPDDTYLMFVIEDTRGSYASRNSPSKVYIVHVLPDTLSISSELSYTNGSVSTSGNPTTYIDTDTYPAYVVYHSMYKGDYGYSDSTLYFNITTVTFTNADFNNMGSTYTISGLLTKGDTVYCNAGIISYKYGSNEAVTLNTKEFSITSTGMYSISMNTYDDPYTHPECIIKTKNGSLINLNYSVDGDDLLIYGNDHLSVNGTKLTENGLQRIPSALINGRASIKFGG